VIYDNKLVIDTGYHGENSEDYRQQLATNIPLKNEEFGEPNPPVNNGNTAITEYTGTNPPLDPDCQAGTDLTVLPPCLGYGTASFVKTSASPTIVTVKVYAPNDGTAWAFQVDCPKP
jgi:hypothetical protein